MDRESTPIFLPLPEQAPVDEEGIDAVREDDGPDGAEHWRLVAAPFVSYDVARGDLVRCTRDDQDRPVFQAIVEPGGHHTARVLLDASLDLMGRMKVLLGLKELGAVAEEPRGRYYALDLGPEVDLDAVAEHLDTLSEQGALEFELVE